MSFVDVTVPYATAGGSVSAQVGGAPQGGGITYTNTRAPVSQPGAGAAGTNASLKFWVIVFFILDAGILLTAGVLFNGKGS